MDTRIDKESAELVDGYYQRPNSNEVVKVVILTREVEETVEHGIFVVFIDTQNSYFSERLSSFKENYKLMPTWEERSGEFFGYPKCCIAEHKNRIKLMLSGVEVPPTLAEMSNCASHGTGFIPCEEHTNQLLRGETTIQQLLTNRVATGTFPYGGPITDFIEYMRIYPRG